MEHTVANTADHPLLPPFEVQQYGEDYFLCDQEKALTEGTSFRDKEQVEWMCEALNFYWKHRKKILQYPVLKAENEKMAATIEELKAKVETYRWQ